MYEDVTVDVQPDPDRHLTQGWIYGFADGPGGYPQEWTAREVLRLARVPRPQRGVGADDLSATTPRWCARSSCAWRTPSGPRAYDGWNPPWLKFVERNLGAWMHAENGLALHVFTAIQRSGPTNMINTAVAVNAAHKMRFAQDLALFNLDLSEAATASTAQAHREVWQYAPEWQPTREDVERLTAVGDWCELLFATNIVFEQLVGELFRSELVMQIAARNGDYITPTIVGTGENDYDRDLGYTRALFPLLARDEEHGEANKELFGGWLAMWVPRCLDAAHALQPIWSQPAEKVVTFAVQPRRRQGQFRAAARRHRARHPRRSWTK